MTFPNLPGAHNYQNRAKLERACEELEYYRRKVSDNWMKIGLDVRNNYSDKSEALIAEIETATPETAAELFTRARELCRDMEKILAK